MNEYLISDLKPKYLTYLYKHIPILAYGIDEKGELYNSMLTKDKNGTLLLQLILNYCKECMLIERSDKESFIISSSLKNINSFLKKISKNVTFINGFNNNKPIIDYKNNKVIKKYNINALALIEGMILCTLNYYKNRNSNNNKKFPNINVSINDNAKKINLKMNIAPGENLGYYIIKLYKSNVSDKNSELLDILKEISEKLDNLQKNYGFIHGDFHSGNIYIKKNDATSKNKYIITFIDFEYSTIKLPSKKNKNIILTSPVSENISRKYILNLDEEYGLKALDLFHLIDNLKSFERNNTTINEFKGYFNKFDEYKKFIEKLTALYPYKALNKTKIHIPTREINFFNESYSNLYPENFLNIELNNFPEIPIITTEMSSMHLGYSFNSPSKPKNLNKNSSSNSSSNSSTKRKLKNLNNNNSSNSSSNSSTRRKLNLLYNNPKNTPPSTPKK